MSTMKQWTEAECLVLNMIESHAGDGRSPHEGWHCRWVAPYGWVPEACCPVHDAPEPAAVDVPHPTE